MGRIIDAVLCHFFVIFFASYLSVIMCFAAGAFCGVLKPADLSTFLEAGSLGEIVLFSVLSLWCLFLGTNIVFSWCYGSSFLQLFRPYCIARLYSNGCRKKIIFFLINAEAPLNVKSKALLSYLFVGFTLCSVAILSSNVTNLLELTYLSIPFIVLIICIAHLVFLYVRVGFLSYYESLALCIHHALLGPITLGIVVIGIHCLISGIYNIYLFPLWCISTIVFIMVFSLFINVMLFLATSAVLVYPISSVPKPHVSDGISGENPESEQIDTKESVDDSGEK